MALLKHAVFRQKEESLTLYGLSGGVIASVAAATALMVLIVGWLVGLVAGALALAASFTVFAGKAQFWFLYNGLYFVRGLRVLTPAAPPEEKVERALLESRMLHEAQ